MPPDSACKPSDMGIASCAGGQTVPRAGLSFGGALIGLEWCTQVQQGARASACSAASWSCWFAVCLMTSRVRRRFVMSLSAFLSFARAYPAGYVSQACQQQNHFSCYVGCGWGGWVTRWPSTAGHILSCATKSMVGKDVLVLAL